MLIRNESVSVGTTQAKISALQPLGKRQVFIVTNMSTGGEVITLSLGQEANAGAGIVLTAYGSAFVESADSGFIPSEMIWYAVSSGAGGLIAVHERVI
jgi:hypothetical protein